MPPIVAAPISWIHAFYVLPDRASTEALAAELGFRLGSDGVWWHPDGHAVDVIGTLYAEPVGEEAPEPLPGIHINIVWAGQPHPAGEPYRVHPATPRRVWA